MGDNGEYGMINSKGKGGKRSEMGGISKEKYSILS